MPMENQSAPTPESFGNVPHDAEGPFNLPQVSAEFRTVPNASEDFSKVPKVAERNENHTLTVREVARMFEAAGVARTERSIINWCQPNRQGNTRLNSYYDPNERKYYITPQSVEAVIQEELQRAKWSAEPNDGENFGKHVAHVKHPSSGANEPDEWKIEKLQREVQNLKIADEVKDKFIKLLTSERMELIEKLESASRQVGKLETRLLQSAEPHI